MCINKYLPFEQNILIELTCRAAMFCPTGNGVLGCQSPSPLGLSSILCACLKYAVPVRDTLCLS